MWKIPLFKIYWEGDDIAGVAEVIKSGMNWATGPNVQIFEKSVADYLGLKYAVSFNSGTSALHSAIVAHDIGAGDEVIVPSFTFIATANAPLFVGARPVFADIEPRTYGLDANDVLEKITPHTKAIVPVHIGGCPCNDIRALEDISNDTGIPIIEDAAESLGSKIGDKPVGTFGESAMFSFCAPKVITTGEGGIIVTDSYDISERLKLIRSHGRAETKDYFSTNEYLDYVDLGYNFRMSNITAALGISQMKKLDKIIEKRRYTSDILSGRLSRTKEIELPSPPENFYHLYQMYTIKAPRRDDLMNYLTGAGIMSKVYFPPIHQSHFYKNVLKFDVHLPVTEEIVNKVLTLPMYPDMSIGEITYISEMIEAFYEAH